MVRWGETNNTLMGLFDGIMGSLMGGRIEGALRENCPAAVLPALEKLLADPDAVKTITGYVGDCMGGLADLSAKDLRALPFGAAVADLLQRNPGLVEHLVATAKDKLGL